MHLIHILLPLEDNDGRPYGKEAFRVVADELTEKFGGVTASTRAPAEGMWKDGSSKTSKDEIVIFEVMAPRLARKWWGEYRRLEEQFRQEKIVVRSQRVRML